MSESNNRHHQRSIIRVGGCPVYKRPIQLQGVEWETLEITERRVTNAKIVDGNLYSQLPHFTKLFDRGFRVLHDRSLRQLQLKAICSESGVVQNLHHSLEEICLLKLACRNIHSDVNISQAGLPPPSG